MAASRNFLRLLSSSSFLLCSNTLRTAPRTYSSTTCVEGEASCSCSGSGPRYPASPLKGSVILITGGTQGIGAGTAKVLARLGANVVVTGRSEAKGKKFAAEVNELGTNSVTFVAMDVTKEASVQAAVQTTVEKFGRLDHVFANAGLGPLTPQPPHLWSSQDIHTLIDTNIYGPVWTVKYAVPHLLKAKNSSIVVCSSVAGSLPQTAFAGLPGHVIYSMSKAAMDQFVRGLAGAYAKSGIRAYGLNPYWVDTELTQKFLEESKMSVAAVEKMNNTKKLATSEDMGLTVATMMDGSTTFQPGECIMVESGPTTWSMQVYYSQLGDPKAVMRKLKVEGRDLRGNPLKKK